MLPAHVTRTQTRTQMQTQTHTHTHTHTPTILVLGWEPAPLTGVSGPWGSPGPKCRKSLECFPGPGGPGTSKRLGNGSAAGGAGRYFRGNFGTFRVFRSRRARETSVGGRLVPKCVLGVCRPGIRHENGQVFDFRVVETVVLENGRLPPVENRWFDENWRKLWYCILTTKTRDFAPQTLEIDENDENGGCPPGKMTVCQKHCFDNPDDWKKSDRGFLRSLGGGGGQKRVCQKAPWASQKLPRFGHFHTEFFQSKVLGSLRRKPPNF